MNEITCNNGVNSDANFATLHLRRLCQALGVSNQGEVIAKATSNILRLRLF